MSIYDGAKMRVSIAGIELNDPTVVDVFDVDVESVPLEAAQMMVPDSRGVFTCTFTPTKQMRRALRRLHAMALTRAHFPGRRWRALAHAYGFSAADVRQMRR